jgi:polyisoprenoid-binding protein YceI
MTKVLAAASPCIFALPALAREDAFVIDSTRTQATFLVNRSGFTSILGVFAKSGGTVWIDEDHCVLQRFISQLLLRLFYLEAYLTKIRS